MATVVAKSKPVPRRARAQDVDRHVGARMRERRVMLGLTQQQMAELIGVTYQQAHKYEKGINRVAAGRLYNIAQALGVDMSYFFEGLSSDKAHGLTSATGRGAPASVGVSRLVQLARMESAQPGPARGQPLLCPVRRLGPALRSHQADAPALSQRVLRGPVQSMCRPCHSANTMTGAHIDGTPAPVEDAQTPVMNLYEELTAQLGGPSGIAVAVPEDAIAWSANPEGIRRALRVRQ